jgi:hypothetical protein
MSKGSEKVTVERIEAAMAKLAAIIEDAGDDVYWPIFERLEREREKLIGRQERLQAAKARVSSQAAKEKRAE